MIDLHIHTNHSDGSESVENIIKEAQRREIEIISFTDHDNIDAYFELRKIKNKKDITCEIITGCEFKCFLREESIPIEILGYGFNISKLQDKAKEKKIIRIQNKYLKHLKEVGNKIGLVFDPTIEIKDMDQGYASEYFQRELLKSSINEEILKKNQISLEPNFYRAQQCNKNSIFYINEREDFEEPGEIVKKIHQAGGLAFLAHPYIYPTNRVKEMIQMMAQKYKIDGIECYYSTFSNEQTKELLKEAEKYHLYISGGTDFHGERKPSIKIGIGTGNFEVKKEVAEEWIKKISSYQ